MLKKSLLFVLVALVVLSATITASAATIDLVIDGKKVESDVAPYLDETNTTLVPLRVISETLGADVSWDQAKQQATVETAAYKVVFTIGSRNFTVNGATKTSVGPAKLVNNRTMVPIRAFSEAIGADVNYIASTHTATVDYFTKMTGTLKISGSTTVQPIVQAAADNLVKDNSGLSITVAGGGSGAGMKDAMAGTVNIGMSSRDLKPEELAVLSEYEVALDAIAIIVHPDNKVKNLTKDQAAKIMLGEIKNWKDVGGDDAPIFVQSRETGSGTRATLEEMLLDKVSVVATATSHTSTSLLKQAVAKEKNSIGYVSLGFVDNTVKALSLDNIEAKNTTVYNKTYPLSRALYVATKGTPSKTAAMFIDYLKSSACQNDIVAKEGYIPLDK